MFDYGSGNINEIMGALYDYYEVQCIAEGIESINKELFYKTVLEAYDYFFNNTEQFIVEDKIMRVVLNSKNGKPFLCIDLEPAESGNVELFLIVEPEAQDEY